jgi:glutathione S-transferase
VLTRDYFDPPSDGVVLFHAARSYCAQQVRVALEEKGVAWRSRPLELGKADHFDPAYARMNPHMVVPTLADYGRIVRDAARIIRYIDLRFDGPQLCPDDPDARSRMDHWIDVADAVPVKYLSVTNLPDDLRTRQLKGWHDRLDALARLMNEHGDDPDLSALYRRKHDEIQEWCRYGDNGVS